MRPTSRPGQPKSVGFTDHVESLAQLQIVSAYRRPPIAHHLKQFKPQPPSSFSGSPSSLLLDRDSQMVRSTDLSLQSIGGAAIAYKNVFNAVGDRIVTEIAREVGDQMCSKSHVCRIRDGSTAGDEMPAISRQKGCHEMN